jgi:hypothetical protein
VELESLTAKRQGQEAEIAQNAQQISVIKAEVPRVRKAVFDRNEPFIMREVSVIKIVDGGSITIIDGRSGGLPVLSRFRMVVPFATLWGRNREPVFVDYESAGLRV